MDLSGTAPQQTDCAFYGTLNGIEFCSDHFEAIRSEEGFAIRDKIRSTIFNNIDGSSPEDKCEDDSFSLNVINFNGPRLYPLENYYEDNKNTFLFWLCWHDFDYIEHIFAKHAITDFAYLLLEEYDEENLRAKGQIIMNLTQDLQITSIPFRAYFDLPLRIE